MPEQYQCDRAPCNNVVSFFSNSFKIDSLKKKKKPIQYILGRLLRRQAKTENAGYLHYVRHWLYNSFGESNVTQFFN